MHEEVQDGGGHGGVAEVLADGVYRCDADGVPAFVEAQAPTDDELHALLQTVITRLMKMLTRRGALVELKLKTPWRDGTTQLVMTPLVFMQRLAALVPRPSLHLIRFHGVLAPNAKLRPRVVPQGPEVQERATEVAVADECEVETVQTPGRTVSAGRGCSSGSSTSTCSTARTAAPGN